jgi:hypothetical protein
MVKKFFLFIVLPLFLLMQLIQPERNLGKEGSRTDITTLYNVPDSVTFLLNHYCFDCHSNNTDYPWFTNIQPIHWYVNSTIKEGKLHLNFAEFGTYTKEIAAQKLGEIINVMQEESMPLKSYRWYKSGARFTPQQRNMMIAWARSLKAEIEVNGLIDPYK